MFKVEHSYDIAQKLFPNILLLFVHTVKQLHKYRSMVWLTTLKPTDATLIEDTRCASSKSRQDWEQVAICAPCICMFHAISPGSWSLDPRRNFRQTDAFGVLVRVGWPLCKLDPYDRACVAESVLGPSSDGTSSSGQVASWSHFLVSILENYTLRHRAESNPLLSFSYRLHRVHDLCHD